MQPDPEVPKQASLMDFVRFVWRYTSPYKLLFILVMVMLLIQTTVRVLIPIGYQQLFDRAIGQQDTVYLKVILSLLVGGWLLQTIASLIQDYFAAWVAADAMTDLKMDMLKQLLSLSDDYFSQTRTGELMSRFSNDLVLIEHSLVESVYNVVLSLLILCTSILMLFFIDFRLALLTFGSLPIAWLGPHLLAKRAQRKNVECKELEGKVSTTLKENITAHTVIRTFGIREARQNSFHQQLKHLAEQARSAYFAGALVARSVSQTTFFLQIAIMGAGGYFALSGSMTVGSLISFVALLLSISNATSHISDMLPDVFQASAGAQRAQEFLQEKPQIIDQPDASELPKFSSCLRFEDVSFGYTPETQVLHTITFALNAGETIGIVGPSGSGKSTVLSLLLRLYDPNHGRVLMDEHDLRRVTVSSLRMQCSVVFQDTVLFDSTLRDNIRIGKPDATEEEVVIACKQAEIHDMIMQMPLQYDTLVGESGGLLSGGQRQRIAIARAILRDPTLMILDEATSALDPLTENAINQTLNKVGKGRTLISITHRLQSICHMDKILVFDQGKLVEQGRHDDLLQNHGLYSQLWKKQTRFTLKEDGLEAECSVESLQSIPLLSLLDQPRLEVLTNLFISEHYAANREVFASGEAGDKFYMIVHGTVQIVLPDEVAQQSIVMDDGDYFGEMALLHNAPRNATVKTLAPTLFLTLNRSHFQQLLKEEPALRKSIEEEVTLRLKRSGILLEEL